MTSESVLIVRKDATRRYRCEVCGVVHNTSHWHGTVRCSCGKLYKSEVTAAPIDIELRPGAEFECQVCIRVMMAPSAKWANNFLCHCGQEYRRLDPVASQVDLNHLFGIKPADYDDFGSF